MTNLLVRWWHELGSPQHCYRLTRHWALVSGVLAAVLLGIGLVWSLIISPPDFRQSDAVRIMYIHVPSAWLSMALYTAMAVAAFIGLVWRMKAAHVVAKSAAVVGMVFTALTLITGMVWGKPMWGTWWTWGDARLVSELVLLFLYIGVLVLREAFDDVKRGDQAAGLLAVVGVINVPIIHYSVLWWQTLHQPASLSTLEKIKDPSIEGHMLVALLVMLAGFSALAFSLVSSLVRSELVRRDAKKQWVQALIKG